MEVKYTLKKQITVEVPIEKAFRVFTEGFDTWWPRTHHIASAPMKQAILEPKLGGRWYEKVTDGTECDWGKVIAWEPPNRVAVTWQLTHEYKYDPNFVTEVEVIFEAQGASKTLVTLLHKNLDRYGDNYDKIIGSIGSEGGWLGLMKVFAAEVEGKIEEKNRMLRSYEVGMAELNAG